MVDFCRPGHIFHSHNSNYVCSYVEEYLTSVVEPLQAVPSALSLCDCILRSLLDVLKSTICVNTFIAMLVLTMNMIMVLLSPIDH